LARGENGREKSFILQAGSGRIVVENSITNPPIESSILATARHEGKMAKEKVAYNRSGVVAQW
jgi:hypothetical protein